MVSKRLQSPFLKSFSILVSGTVLAQVITLIASPIMTRLFTTEMIGEYTLVMTAVGLFGSVICARYDVAIVSEEDESYLMPLIVLCLIITVVLSLILSLCFLLYYYFNGYTWPQISLYITSILVLLIVTGLSNVLISYNNRNKEYKLMSGIGVIRAFVKECIMIIGGIISPATWLLIVSHIIGVVLGTKYQSKSLRKDNHLFEQMKVLKQSTLIDTAKRHWRQPAFSTPALFVNNFSYSSINIFIKSLFGSSILGLYSISYRLLGLPIAIVGQNISKVYLEEASRRRDHFGNYTPLFIKVSFLLLLLAIPMVCFMYIFAPVACEWFFGHDYYEAGLYVRYLSPMFGLRFIVGPLTIGCQVSNKQQIDFYIQFLLFIMSIVLFLFLSIYSLSIYSYLLLISISYSIIYVIYYLYLFRISRK